MIDVKKLPVQARLTQEELDLLDQVATVARQRIRGLAMSRAEALRLAAVRGAQVLLAEWRTPPGAPSPGAGPALIGLEESTATAPGPALENSTDLVETDFDTSKFVLGRKLCRGQHEHGNTGRTLLRLLGRKCPQCVNVQKRQQRAREREGTASR
jgi:hypothetical protein